MFYNHPKVLTVYYVDDDDDDGDGDDGDDNNDDEGVTITLKYA